MAEIPAGKLIGERVGAPVIDEADHFIKCRICGGWIDMRDLSGVLAHEEPDHKAEAVS